jgi:8-oxo-dGTP pyrophosphatase MutT (NUDIX family)
MESTLTAQWLRDSFSAGVAKAAPDIGQVVADSTSASVLIPLVLRPTGITVLLTQRTAHLNDHAGQVSFPGGRRDDADADAVATALREANEEVGLDHAQIEVISVMPEYWTSSGFRITPVVALVTPPLNLKLDDFEVADVFEPPLAFLLDPANWRRDSLEREGQRREYWAMPWQGRYIWGVTAGMLVNLRRFLLG